jgi:hypothetical protein
LYEKATKEAGNREVKAEDLERIYRREMPQDLKKRLEKASYPGTGLISKLNNKFISRDLNGFSKKLEKKIGAIDGLKIEPAAKQQKIDELLGRYGKKLNDMDRMVSREGAVDSLSYWLLTGEKTSKNASTILMLDTLTLGRLANIIKEHSLNFDWFSSDEKIDKKNIERILNKETPSGSETKVATEKFEPTSASNKPNISFARNESSVPDEGMVKKALVGKGEGIEHSFIRQLRADPDKYGYMGDPNDQEGIARWSNHEAHLAAIKLGYVDPVSGAEVRVAKPDRSVYVLDKSKAGILSSKEYQINAEGNLIETEAHTFDHNTEKGVEFEGNAKNEYEYISTPQRSLEAPDEISPPGDDNETKNLENIERKESELEVNGNISPPEEQPIKDDSLNMHKTEILEPVSNDKSRPEGGENKSFSENILKLSDHNGWTPGDLNTAFSKIDVSNEKNGEDTLRFFISNNIKDPRDVFCINDIAKEKNISLEDTFRYYAAVKDMRSTQEASAIITIFNRPNDQKALAALFGDDFQNLKGQTNVFKDGYGNMVITNKAGITSRESLINITPDGKISAYKKGLIYGHLSFLENAPLTKDKLKIAIKYMTEVK